MNLREQFEKLHPAPEGVRYDSITTRPYYAAPDEIKGADNRWKAELQNALWQGFQSGHAAGLEDAIKAVCETEGKIVSQVRAIRAMKEPK